MLLSKSGANTKINFSVLDSQDEHKRVNWTAEYLFGKSNRKVVNHIQGRYKFEDGKIIEHIDSFDMWKWSSQALGISGSLLGWSSFMKNKIQKTTNKQLDRYMQTQSD